MATLNEVLTEVKVVGSVVKDLKETDLPEIKAKLNLINGRTQRHDTAIAEHKVEIKNIKEKVKTNYKLIIGLILGSSAVTTSLAKIADFF